MTEGVTSYRDLQVWRQAMDWAMGVKRPLIGRVMKVLALAEAETQLILAERLGYILETDAKALLAASSDVSRMLAALSASLTRRKNA